MKKSGIYILAIGIGVIGLCIFSIAAYFNLSMKNNENYDEIAQCILQNETVTNKDGTTSNDTLKESIDKLKNQTITANTPFPSANIRSGILDFKLKKLSIEGNEATANAKYVGYHVWLEKESEDKYRLTMTMSQYDNIYILKREDNIWRIAEIPQYQQNFAPDSFARIKGTYATPEEALDAAEKIDPEKENPFHSVLRFFNFHL